MAKTLSNYNPTVNIGGGITPAGGEFPVAESHDILVDADGKRLDAKLDEIDAQIGGTGETSVATQLGQKVAKSDITTSAPASTNTDTQVPSTKSMYTALATKPTGTLSTAKPVSSSTDTEIPTSKAVYTGLAEKVNTADITTSAPASTNTDAQVPSTKSMYTALATKPTAALQTAAPSSSSTDAQVTSSKAIYTALSGKINTSDIASTVAATGSTSATKVPSETAVRAAIEAKTIPLENSVPAAGDSPSATAAPSVAATRTAIDAAIDDASQDFEDAAAALQTSYSAFTNEIDAKIGDPTDVADDGATAVWPRLKNAEVDIDALSGQFLITDALTTAKMADNTRFYIYTGKEIHVVNATTDITDTTGDIIYKYIGATSGNYTKNNLYKYDTGTSTYVAVTAADALNITVEGSSVAGTIYRPNYWFYYDTNTWKQGSNVSSVTVDSTLSITGAAADAKATGDAITELSNDLNYKLYGDSGEADTNEAKLINFNSITKKLNWINDNLFSYINLKHNGYKLKCNLTTNTIGYSKSNITLFIKVKPNTIYKITKLSSIYFRTAFFETRPEYNSTVINNTRLNHDGKTEIILSTTTNTNYIGIWYYNNNDNYNEEYYYDNINIYEYIYNEQYTTNSVKLNKDNIIESVNAVSIPEFYNSYRQDKLNYKVYYCKIKNPSNILYQNQPIEIKLHLDDFICKDWDYIRIYNNGTEIPFQFEEVFLNLLVENYNNTYYNSGYIKNCILWVYGSLNANEVIEYELRIYESKQTYNFAQNITLDTLTNTQQMHVSDGTNVFSFATILSSGAKRLYSVNNDNIFGIFDRIKLPNSNEIFIRESVENNIDFISEKILGNGIIFYEIEIVHETEFFRWINRYRIFKNQIKTNTIQIVKQDFTKNDISNLYHAFYLGNGSSIINSETENYKSASVLLSNNRRIQVSIIYNNGNIPRSDNNNRIPYMSPNSGFAFSSSNNAVQVYTGCGTTSLNQIIPKGFYFSECIYITFDSDNNTYLQHFNPLCGFASNTNEIILKEKIKPSILNFMNIITDWGQRVGYGLGVNGMGQYIKYWRYKLGITPWGSIKALIKTYIIDNYNLSNAASFRAAMDIPWGIEYQGRVMPIIYLMYKEAVKLNDQTAANEYKNLVIEHGIFFANLFEEFNNDIPLNTNSSSVRNNARTSALHCLACAITLDPDNERLNTTYQSLAQVIIQNSDFNTMLKEGNLSDSRYSHYMNFAMYQWVISDKMIPINDKDNFNNYDNFIIDIFEPGGEIKDSYYCPSTCRRAEPHTYAYCLAVLYLIGGFGNLSLCEQIINHLHENIKPNGDPAFPMDRYPGEWTTDSIHTYVFALGAFAFLNEYL